MSDWGDWQKKLSRGLDVSAPAPQRTPEPPARREVFRAGWAAAGANYICLRVGEGRGRPDVIEGWGDCLSGKWYVRCSGFIPSDFGIDSPAEGWATREEARAVLLRLVLAILDEERRALAALVEGGGPWQVD